MGTEALWVPLALATAAGTAQYVDTQKANKRADTAEAQAITNQQGIRAKGNAEVNQTVSDIARSNPNAIAAKSTSDYVNQLRRNSAGSAQPGISSSLAPVPGASSRYGADTKAAQNTAQTYGSGQASELGDLDAAVRQRQNEGLEAQTLNTGLNTLNVQSVGQNFVDQLRAQATGQSSPWLGLTNALLGNAANTTSRNPQWFASTAVPSGGATKQVGI